MCVQRQSRKQGCLAANFVDQVPVFWGACNDRWDIVLMVICIKLWTICIKFLTSFVPWLLRQARETGKK